MLSLLAIPSRAVFAAVALSFLATTAAPLSLAATPATGEIPSAVLSALVQVEAFVQTAEGDDPSSAGWSKRCANCGQFHNSELGEVLKEERPASFGGYLVAPDRVLTADPMIHPRFIREWRVRLGDETVTARPIAWAADRKAALFALERPFKAGRPLVFSPDAAAPYSVLTYSREGNGWNAFMQPLGSSWLTRADGRRFRAVPSDSLVLAADGSPVALCASENLPAGDAWKAVYTSWPWLDQPGYSARLAANEHTANATILHATLQFRPVPVQPGEQPSYRDDDDDKATTLHTTALVLGGRRVLILKDLKPALTARLETVRLTLADGTKVSARFVASATEFGAFVVEPEQTLQTTLQLASTPWDQLQDRLLFTAEVRIKNEERRAFFGHLRSIAVEPGLKGREVPTFGNKTDQVFIFDQDGRLLGAPLAKRAQPTGERWDSRPDAFSLQAAELGMFTGETASWADARNVPRSVAEERQLAWLGVELQPLGRDLAQAHGVSAQTENGDTGALVTYVYPESPAARAGLAAGDVLLRILPVNTHRALPVRVEEFPFSDKPFPWDRYDQISDAYFDRIPRPWVPAENALSKLLLELGFDTPFTLDYTRDGKVATASLVVERGPIHYGSAPEAVASAYGLRLRELTYETRRFYQIPAGQPGLLVARVESGGPAAVAGLKPFEVVTTVDDKPVASVAEFEAAIATAKPLRLGVRRMHKVRLVNLTPAPEPAAQ